MTDQVELSTCKAMSNPVQSNDAFQSNPIPRDARYVSITIGGRTTSLNVAAI